MKTLRDEKEVCSLSLARMLKELGFPQSTKMYWFVEGLGDYAGRASLHNMNSGIKTPGEYFSAPCYEEFQKYLPNTRPGYNFVNHRYTDPETSIEYFEIFNSHNVSYKVVQTEEVNALALMVQRLCADKVICFPTPIPTRPYALSHRGVELINRFEEASFNHGSTRGSFADLRVTHTATELARAYLSNYIASLEANQNEN